MKIKKNKEEQEQDIVYEFVKDLDFSDEKVKKRFLMECSKQEVFQTDVGKTFLNELLEKKKNPKVSLKEKKEWLNKNSKKFGILIGLVIIIFTSVRVIMTWTKSVDAKNEIAKDMAEEVLADDANELVINTDCLLESQTLSTDILGTNSELEDKFEEIFRESFRSKNRYQNDTYIFEYSDTEIIKEEELKEKTYDQLYFALYEIYARHGRTFYDLNLQSYFEAKDWYQPMPKEETFSEKELNDTERENILAIKELMDLYTEENNTAEFDYSSLSIDTIKQYVSEVYKIQKSYLYSFTITEYFDGEASMEECFNKQKEKLDRMFQTNLLTVNIDEAREGSIRAMFCSMLEAGYLKINDSQKSE